MRTIARNATRQIAALKTTLTVCRVYTLENYFAGAEVEPSCAWNALERRGGKLTDHGDGRYTVQVHSNCWYELRRAS